MLRFVTTNDLSLDAASVEGLPSRSITGLAAPYGVEATVSDGTRVILG